MKIIAVGKNYRDHAIEFDGSNEKPAVPMIFMKPDSAIIKNGKHFYVPDFLGRVDYEAEIVVRINKLGKSIPARFAHRYYDAITVGIDFTARDMQRGLIERGEPWDLSKGFDGSAVLGEFLPVERYNVLTEFLHSASEDSWRTSSEFPAFWAADGSCEPCSSCS